MGYPAEFAFLEPLANHCLLAADDQACESVWRGLKPEIQDDLLMAFRRLRDEGRLEAFASRQGFDDTEAAGECWSMVILLDYLVRTAQVPPDLAGCNLIEWDDREFDDNGDEW
ncbi:MAG: hypothetical protein ACPGYV_05360 [Phycisphaeraceae bacterium]